MSEEVTYIVDKEKLEHAAKCLFVARRPYVEYKLGEESALTHLSLSLEMANQAIKTSRDYIDRALETLKESNKTFAEWIEELEEPEIRILF